MKAFSGLSCILLLAAAIPAHGQYVYVRSNVNQPWGQATNEDAMDNVFGAGTWATMYYETLDAATMLTTQTQFLFLEGGDSSYLPFAEFINNNINLLSVWISNGGRLLIMSAPNDPLLGVTLTLPDNITLSSDAFYGSAANSAYPTDTSNPIFSGPNSTAYYFTGDFFSHGYFMGQNLANIMQSNLNETVLGLDVIGSGLMVVGGMTTDNFQLPQPAAHALLENIIYYTFNVTL
jgi:hypothetical protein